MNEYEIAVLFDPGLEVALDKATDRIEKIFKDNGGKVVATDNWGKKKLAYPIKKHDQAIYIFYTVALPAEKVIKVEANLNITEEVIRFLITRPDLKAIAKAKAAQEEQDKREADRKAKNEGSAEDEKDDEESVQ
jgi:small subunit ribosomal protein S6